MWEWYMPSVLRLNSDIVRRTEHFAFCAKCRNYIPGDSALTLNNLDQRQIHDAPLYGRHDYLLAEEQLAHSRPCLVLSDDVIGHRDKVTTAAIER